MHSLYELHPRAFHPQLVDETECIFRIPWGHHRILMDKCGGNEEKALFYIRKTIDNSWSRATLLNWLDSDLYERQGKAITNFSQSLPTPQGDLAQEITKDPYNFDFLAIRQQYDEKELKDALMNNIQKFLLELGTGFLLLVESSDLLLAKLSNS